MVQTKHQTRHTFAGAFLLTLSLLAGNTPVVGQSLSPDPADTDSTNKQQADVDKKEKRGSLVIAPIPISSPAFGSGLLLITAYVFKFDKEDAVSPPSWVGMAGAFTNNGSRGLATGARLYLKENKYQTTFAAMKGRANLDFFGIGRIPGRTPISVPLSMEGSIFFGELMRNVGNNIFIGPRYQYRRLSAGLDGPRPPGGFEIPEIDLKSNSAALGFHMQRDRRDSTFYPTRGSLIDFTGDFFDQVWGSRREYQTYKIAYNGFRQVTSRQVLAYARLSTGSNCERGSGWLLSVGLEELRGDGMSFVPISYSPLPEPVCDSLSTRRTTSITELILQ